MRYLPLLLLLAIAACTKKSSDTARLHFSGQVYDSTSKAGIAGVPIKAYYIRYNGNGVTQEDVPLATVTDASGHFDVNIDLEKARIEQGQIFYLTREAPAAYFRATALEPYYKVTTTEPRNVTDLHFPLLLKVPATVTFVRTGTDVFSNVALDYSAIYSDVHPQLDLIFSPPPAGDSRSFSIDLAPEVPAYLYVAKQRAGSTTTEYKYDTVRPLRNAPNTYTVRY